MNYKRNLSLLIKLFHNKLIKFKAKCNKTLIKTNKETLFKIKKKLRITKNKLINHKI